MKSTGLQQNFIWFLENNKKETPKEFGRRRCCEKCRFSTKDAELFERHVAHHKEVTFSCNLCSHVSYSRVESQRHLVSHKGSFPYKCNWCSYGAVRRDYMVKHIQRIHGKPADGDLTMDWALPAAKVENQTADQSLEISRTLSEPTQNMTLLSQSAGNVFGLLPSANQPRASAPYILLSSVQQTNNPQTHLICSPAAQSVGNTTCILPVSKTVSTPHSLPSSSHTVITHGISNLANATGNQVEHLLPGRTSSGTAITSSLLPRVHINVPADHATQQKTLLQSHVGASPEKTVLQAKTVTSNPVIFVSEDHASEQKTLLQSQVGVATEKTVFQTKTVANNPIICVSADRATQPKLLQQNQVVATTEKTVFQTKTVASNQVICVSADRAIQQKSQPQNQVGATEKIIIQSKTAPKSQIPLPAGTSGNLKTLLSSPVEPVRQRAIETWNVTAASLTQKPVHTGVIRTIPVANAVQRPIQSGAHPSTQVEQFGQGAPSFSQRNLNAEIPNRRKTRPNILSKRPTEKLNPSTQSSVQVELLAPLNQPIVHNRPLTVSCPEEITIPAGCLVELVEVKTINGTRELELRLVPQQPHAQQAESLRAANTTTPNSTSRMSFKCKVSANETGPMRLNHGTNSLQINAIPEPQGKGPHLKEHSSDLNIDVKEEPEVKVVCSKISVIETPGSLTGGFCDITRSVAKSSESHAPSAGHKTVGKTTETATQLRQTHCRERTKSQSANTTKAAGVKRKLSAPEASNNKQENVESSYQGLPVISSVFSLCPGPEATLNGIHVRGGIADEHAEGTQKSSDSGLSQSMARVNNSTICKTQLKTEKEIIFSTKNIIKPGVNLKEKMDVLVKDTKLTETVVPENVDTVPKEQKDKVVSKVLSSLSTDAHPTGAADKLVEINDSPLSRINLSEQCEEKEKTSVSGSSLVVQKQSNFVLPMYPTVALARIPSLDFYSLVQSTKKVSERPADEESITARPVLYSTSSQQNVQEKAIKLVLKRKRSESENKNAGQDYQSVLAHFVIQSPHKKHKEKKRAKKHKPSNDTLNLSEILVKRTMEKLCLMPLKEDQLVKRPAANQPVVVLNHPNPLFQSESGGDQALKDYNNISPACNPQTGKVDTPAHVVPHCPSFIMKLKKVQGQKYEVTELVMKGVSEKTNLCQSL
ncbi:zinc finger protein 518A [Hoplias malabaricus]|uniref:zinc finger protein 518A n=1 Tax=Hoplias malabaricus TaxID=27720 RepID=UPI0034617CD8